MSDSRKNKNEFVRIDLTPEQIQALKAATGKDADAIELTVRELEDRIAPCRMRF